MDIFILFVSSVLFISSIGFVLWYGSQLEDLERENKKLKEEMEDYKEMINYYCRETNKDLCKFKLILQDMPFKLRSELTRFLTKLAKVMKDYE